MQHFPINYIALVVAAIARFLFGWLWYSPLLFGKTWMSPTNCSSQEMKRRMPVLAPMDFTEPDVAATLTVRLYRTQGNAGSTPRSSQWYWLLNRRW
jgi:hypothetical protein